MGAAHGAVMWFRRDLRIVDHPALAAAAAQGPVLPLFVLDPALLAPSGAVRVAFMLRCLRSLDRSLGGRLVVRAGDPTSIVPALAAGRPVFASADFGPYGARRDEVVGRRADLHLVGSPYAVDPGTLRTTTGTGYRVFGPFQRAWRQVPLAAPQPAPADLVLDDSVDGDPLPAEPEVDATLPPAGESAALDALERFAAVVSGYATARDRPDLDATSRLSPYLRWGCVHPRQVLARLGAGPGPDRLRTELAWREFYADVLHHRPESARTNLVRAMDGFEWDADASADAHFDAWCQGRTGYPIVDAGMRQLLAQGWMHNRVRMIAASFLVKDLHLDWRRGARWFMAHLVDGDLASNQHGWQWVAGTGTDPAPFFRVFNPVAQGRRFDPEGRYVRRWVPELRDVDAARVHEPWRLPGGPPAGYPPPIVDHREARAEALRRYDAARSRAVEWSDAVGP